MSWLAPLGTAVGGNGASAEWLSSRVWLGDGFIGQSWSCEPHMPRLLWVGAASEQQWAYSVNACHVHCLVGRYKVSPNPG